MMPRMLLAVVFILIYSKLAISKFVLVETEDEDECRDCNGEGILVHEDNEFEAKNRKVGQDLRYPENRSWGSSPTINNSWEWKCKGQFGRRRKRETFNNKFDL